ncbi:MAG: CcmD family protein [Bacteroidota bacterium]|jgi:hypothetical protein|nr:MAG: CcmD family protein [Bacteroidota bacterium]
MKYLLTLIGLLIATVASAQKDVEMADVMRSNGKIYVVVGIILIVHAGLLVYLFMVDRKVTKLEKEQANRTS